MKNTVKYRVERTIKKLEHKIKNELTIEKQMNREGRVKDAEYWGQHALEDWKIKKTLEAILNDDKDSIYI